MLSKLNNEFIILPILFNVFTSLFFSLIYLIFKNILFNFSLIFYMKLKIFSYYIIMRLIFLKFFTLLISVG